MGPVLREVGDRSAEDGPSLCVDLRRARMTAGYELADIATALRIRLLHLEALEEGRFEDLPGSAYAAGFLRSYCEFLGLQSNEMVERLKRET
ncbi:MAG: helix-turn-helix transcriptional regulator, partial [Pseudomonadota bacterium]|nr:helix-turn-helix transcriptional regulator [Pseudomonadota bacterium]